MARQLQHHHAAVEAYALAAGSVGGGVPVRGIVGVGAGVAARRMSGEPSGAIGSGVDAELRTASLRTEG